MSEQTDKGLTLQLRYTSATEDKLYAELLSKYLNSSYLDRSLEAMNAKH